jgi:cytosine/adenosine deaminase-related metal-dependent hydrolase|tara:strand:+ start:819 stop:1901 length:1083 start_codon:yes stop_codon:yes gene_type:complete
MIAFKNATILSGEDLEPISGWIIVENRKIKEVGEGKCPKKGATDLKRGIVFPGFTNAHTHIGDTIAQDLGIYEPIKKRVGPEGMKFSVLKKNNQRLIGGMKSSINELLNCGTTAFCDFREGGIKGVLKLKSLIKKDIESVILGRPNGGDIQSLLDVCHGIGLSSVADYSPNELKTIKNLVKKKGKILGIHVAEVEDDVKSALKMNPNFMVHLTNTNDENLELIHELKIPVIICPRANAILGAGVPKIKELIDENLVGLGTDNVMVNSLNMFREIEFAFKISRGLTKDPTISGKSILKLATLNGRKILGLSSNAIEEGKEANFIIVGRRKYLYDPIVAILHRYETGDIRGIVKGDQFLNCK